VTETEIKLDDARIQLSLAEENTEDEAVVRSCINSFISLARSVTFVMQCESSSEISLVEWYREEMNVLSNMPLLKFFNERRVYTIHKGTVTLQRTRFAQLRSGYSTDGKAQFVPGYITGWLFDNTCEFQLPKHESAISLCSEYLKILEDLVKRWVLKRQNV
tara:strand:- start:175 stop:657 length:483 start_codon:yes stop_codon:yes gene_type:complete